MRFTVILSSKAIVYLCFINKCISVGGGIKSRNMRIYRGPLYTYTLILGNPLVLLGLTPVFTFTLIYTYFFSYAKQNTSN